MNFFEQKIRSEAQVLPGNILLVDRFLNQGLDIETLTWLAESFADHFKSKQVDLVLTIEASGIAIAVKTAEVMGVNAAFAKKHSALNLSGDLLQTRIKSYTKQIEYTATLAKHLIQPGMQVLIVDDFLAHGCAMQGLIRLVEAGGAEVAGIGIAIEKAFQAGGEKLRASGYDLYSAARIASFTGSDFKLIEQ